MPELPEVETTCKGIKPHIIKQTVNQVIVREKRLRWPIPSNIKSQLTSEKVLDVTRRAKYIFIQFSKGYLIIHLGMSGTLRIVSSKTELKNHDHFDLMLNNNKILRFNDPRRFGAILWATDPIELKIIANLGPEPLGADFNADYFHQKAQRHKIPIKNLIMNNQVVVGVGNIYASESLFMAGIHPLRPSCELTSKQATKLVKAIQNTLKKAISLGGTTLKDFYQSDGRPGYFKNELKVYNRKNEPCYDCGALIKDIRIAQRMTYYCPRCQA